MIGRTANPINVATRVRSDQVLRVDTATTDCFVTIFESMLKLFLNLTGAKLAPVRQPVCFIGEEFFV